MSQVPKLSLKHFKQGFTLIELLVVIAIIGVLASVVLASLNSAREKGKIASIKSNLKNMIPQAELSYDTLGNYSLVCEDTKIASMLDAITSGSGVYASCYSHNDYDYPDVNLRWGASAIIGTSTPLKAYSVSGTSVVTWDTQGVNTSGVSVTPDIAMTWAQANTACSLSGGRLPTLEELKTLTYALYIASGEDSWGVPPGFLNNNYWSSTTVPSTTNAYSLDVMDGYVVNFIEKTSYAYVHCVH